MPKNRVLLEAQNSILSTTVGAVFIADYFFDGNLYSRFPDTYRFMKFWPTLFWGLIYGTAGLVHLYTLFYDHYLIRKQILLVKTFLWIFLGGCVLYGDVFAASGWFYLIFAIFAVTSYWKIQRAEPCPYATTNTDASHVT